MNPTITPSGGDPEPFDDLRYLLLLQHLGDRWPEIVTPANDHLTAPLVPFLRLSRQLFEEVIRLRNIAREAQHRVTLLEQGQQLLPLSVTHNPPPPDHA